jgi:hypothetical protein
MGEAPPSRQEGFMVKVCLGEADGVDARIRQINDIDGVDARIRQISDIDGGCTRRIPIVMCGLEFVEGNRSKRWVKSNWMRASPLMMATRLGHCEVVELLLEFGADPTLLCGEYSALHIAAKHGNLECLDMILRYCRRIEKPSASLNKTPLQCALEQQHEDVSTGS